MSYNVKILVQLLRSYTANWPASCQLGFLNCSFHLLYSVAICIAGPRQPMAANYQPSYQVNIAIISVIIIIMTIITF